MECNRFQQSCGKPWKLRQVLFWYAWVSFWGFVAEFGFCRYDAGQLQRPWGRFEAAMGRGNHGSQVPSEDKGARESARQGARAESVVECFLLRRPVVCVVVVCVLWELF